MATELPAWTLGDLAKRFGGEVDGNADHVVRRPVLAGSDDPEGLTFAESGRYLQMVVASGVGAVIAPPGVDVGGKPAIRHPIPRMAFGILLAMARRRAPLEPGIHPQASVHPTVQVDPTARIGPFAVVEEDAVIGPEACVYPLAYIGARCVLGSQAVVYPQAVLVQDVTLGDRTVVHPGAVIGADGFGYVWDGKQQLKVEQAGRVEIGADCEIGANTCIDRAVAEATKLGDDVKIDNLVQIAHNVHVGDHTVMASMCGISGSTKIGARCVLAGAASTKDHVTITDDVSLGGRSAVWQDITERGEYFGLPAIPVKREIRQLASIRKLPELLDRVAKLEKRLAELEGKS